MPIAALAGILGVVKAKLVLVDHAHRAVDRIVGRGRASALGFFNPASWALIAVMMGAGVLLRHSPLVESTAGRDLVALVTSRREPRSSSPTASCGRPPRVHWTRARRHAPALLA